jgi:parallel beta-helix repeat protein
MRRLLGFTAALTLASCGLARPPIAQLGSVHPVELIGSLLREVSFLLLPVSSGASGALASAVQAEIPAANVTPDASSYPSLNAATAALSPGQTLYLASNYSTTLRSGVTILSAGVTIKCAVGATIEKGGNFTALSVRAPNVTVTGCKINGNGATSAKLSSLSISDGTATVVFNSMLPPNYVAGSAITFFNTGIPGIDGHSFTLLSASGASVTFRTRATGYSSTGMALGGYQGSGINVTGTSNVELTDLTIDRTEGSGIYLRDVSGAKIQHNTITGMAAGDGIYGENNTRNVEVSDNFVDRSLASTWGHAIAFHSTKPGDQVSQITITHNNIKNGHSFCVEVGDFGGLAASGIVVSTNNCFQAVVPVSLGAFGGYSFSGTDGVVAAGNFYFNPTGSRTLLGLEAVTGAHGTFTGNFLWGATADFNGESYSAFTSNCIYALYPKTKGGDAGFYIGGSRPEWNSDFDEVADNLIDRGGLSGSCHAWATNSKINLGTAIIDANRNTKVAEDGKGNPSCQTGRTASAWSSVQGTVTIDNQCQWQLLSHTPNKSDAYSETYYGIQIQCNHTATDCSHLKIHDNIIEDNGTSTGQAINMFALPGSTVRSVWLYNNHFKNWQTCYAVGSFGFSSDSYASNNDESGCERLGMLKNVQHGRHTSTVP